MRSTMARPSPVPLAMHDTGKTLSIQFVAWRANSADGCAMLGVCGRVSYNEWCFEIGCPEKAIFLDLAPSSFERFAASSSAACDAGSSPRPWGTHPCVILIRRDKRFIPTPVGNACKPRSHESGHAVHPHARGERIPRYRDMFSSAGSSPRPWGTPWSCTFPRPLVRFIPTPVGNAPTGILVVSTNPVHPHARGERDDIERGFFPTKGSSPRPWGTLAGFETK